MFYEILGVSLSMSVIILFVLLVSLFLNKRYTAKWRYFDTPLFADMEGVEKVTKLNATYLASNIGLK